MNGLLQVMKNRKKRILSCKPSAMKNQNFWTISVNCPPMIRLCYLNFASLLLEKLAPCKDFKDCDQYFTKIFFGMKYLLQKTGRTRRAVTFCRTAYAVLCSFDTARMPYQNYLFCWAFRLSFFSSSHSKRPSALITVLHVQKMMSIFPPFRV